MCQHVCVGVYQHTHTVFLLCCWRTGDTLLDSFCFFSALCWTSGGLSAVLRRAFLAGGLVDDGDEPSIVLLLPAVLLSAVQSEGADGLGSTVLLCEHSGVRENGSDRVRWNRLLLPESPSFRSKVGRSSHTADGESSSGGRCKSGVSAREMEVGGHWEIFDKSSNTSSWCRVSWQVWDSCRAITIALVLSARNMRCRHLNRA